MAKIICEICKKDIGAPDFECKARVCPLEQFDTHCVIKANGTIRNPKSKRKSFTSVGGPAPSDTPKRILN